MPDLSEMLKQAAAASSDPLDVAMVGRRATRRRRIRRTALACGAGAAVVAVVAGGVALRGDDSERTVAESPDTVPAEPGWSEIDPGPLDGRAEAAVVWTGSEVIVWGGHGLEITTTAQGNPSFDYTGDVRVVGAAYDPATDTWRTLAGAPIDARVGAAAVWTGSEMVVWGGLTPDRERVGPDGAAYDPDTDTWRAIAPAPLSTRVPAAHAWTGTEMIVWGIGGRGTALADGAAYNPDTDTWRAIVPAPLTLNLASAAWAGDEMVIVGSRINEQIRAVDQQGEPIDGATTGARDGLRPRCRHMATVARP